MGNPRDFYKDVVKATQQMRLDSEEVFQNSALDMFDEFRKSTPVVTGNMRDAWTATVNTTITTVTGPGDNPAESSNRSGIETSIANISSAKLGDTIIYMNHATYFPRVERGFVGADSLGRYYNQAGQFFAQRAFSKLRGIVGRVAARFGFEVK